MSRMFLYGVFLLALMMGTSGCVIIPIALPSQPEVRQVVYESGSGWSPDKIAIIEISGILTSGGAGDSFFDSDSSVVDFDKKLKSVENDRKVKAVVLRVDTPGGGVTASDLMYKELERFREKRNIPVYVSMQTITASGGYYISMGADKLYATPTSLTGSIGVIGTFPQARGLMNKIGLDMNAIKSGKNKDAGAFYREMGPDEEKIYQSIINDYFAQFLGVVIKNRQDLSEEDIKRLADGRVYSAFQAYDEGLIDGVAYLDDVIEVAKAEAHLKDPQVVIIKRATQGTADSIYATEASGKMNAQEFNLFKVDAQSLLMPTNEVFNYLWVP